MFNFSILKNISSLLLTDPFIYFVLRFANQKKKKKNQIVFSFYLDPQRSSKIVEDIDLFSFFSGCTFLRDFIFKYIKKENAIAENYLHFFALQFVKKIIWFSFIYVQLLKYPDTQMALSVKSYKPPRVLIEKDDIKINLYAEGLFKVREKNMDLIDAFLVNFVSTNSLCQL